MKWLKHSLYIFLDKTITSCTLEKDVPHKDNVNIVCSMITLENL